jgi:hypothetical protein
MYKYIYIRVVDLLPAKDSLYPFAEEYCKKKATTTATAIAQEEIRCIESFIRTRT